MRVAVGNRGFTIRVAMGNWGFTIKVTRPPEALLLRLSQATKLLLQGLLQVTYCCLVKPSSSCCFRFAAWAAVGRPESDPSLTLCPWSGCRMAVLSCLLQCPLVLYASLDQSCFLLAPSDWKINHSVQEHTVYPDHFACVWKLSY